MALPTFYPSIPSIPRPECLPTIRGTPLFFHSFFLSSILFQDFQRAYRFECNDILINRYLVVVSWLDESFDTVRSSEVYGLGLRSTGQGKSCDVITGRGDLRETSRLPLHVSQLGHRATARHSNFARLPSSLRPFPSLFSTRRDRPLLLYLRLNLSNILTLRQFSFLLSWRAFFKCFLASGYLLFPRKTRVRERKILNLHGRLARIDKKRIINVGI